MITHRDFGIPLPDGTRLSARVWIPDFAETEPVPAILEYLPYRKSDGTIDRDDTMHPWFAAQGYACLRVDRRGCGDSDGLFDDEYSEQELQDGEEIIAWTRGLARGNWGVRTEVITRMRGEADAFLIEQGLRAWDGDGLVFEKQEEARIDR